MPIVPGANAASCVVVPKVPTAAVSTDPMMKLARFRTATGAAKARIFGLEGVSGSSRGSSNNRKVNGAVSRVVGFVCRVPGVLGRGVERRGSQPLS